MPGVAAIALEVAQQAEPADLPGAGRRLVRLPNAAELAAAEDRLRTLDLVTLLLPTRNLAIFVALPLLDRAADLQLPELQEEARKAGAQARPTSIDVRFDAAQHQLVTDVTLERSSGVFDGPWVATLTDQPVRVDLGGIEVGGEPRHRFACEPALVSARGGLGRRKVEKELRERKTKGVLCGLLDQIQIATLLLRRAAVLPGNPHQPLPAAQAAELTFLEVDSAADGVRLSGGLELRNRQPEVGAIQPASALVTGQRRVAQPAAQRRHPRSARAAHLPVEPAGRRQLRESDRSPPHARFQPGGQQPGRRLRPRGEGPG